MNITDPATTKPAKRETNTMPQWAGSVGTTCDISPDWEGGPVDPDYESYWMPVDLYVGGAELRYCIYYMPVFGIKYYLIWGL